MSKQKDSSTASVPIGGQDTPDGRKMLLSEDERTMLLALANQRQQMAIEIDRLSKSLMAFSRMCAFVRGLPNAQSRTWDFKQRGEKDIVLYEIVVEKKEEEGIDGKPGGQS